MQITFAEDIVFEHHIQEDISGCKGRGKRATKLRNEIKQLQSENDELIKAYEKDSIIKALTDTAASIEETGLKIEAVNQNLQWQQKRILRNNFYRDTVQYGKKKR